MTEEETIEYLQTAISNGMSNGFGEFWFEDFGLTPTQDFDLYNTFLGVISHYVSGGYAVRNEVNKTTYTGKLTIAKIN